MERAGTYRVLVGGPEGKGPVGRLGLRWDYNIKLWSSTKYLRYCFNILKFYEWFQVH
jgi:hypothetical protein